MSANVWYKEVEAGLINEIANTTKYLNTAGEEVLLGVDKVFVRDPEEDLTDEHIPCATITLVSGKYNPQRQGTLQVVTDRDYENFKMTIEERAIPYDLTYQIDFWSRYREDLYLMQKTWLGSGHFRQFNLAVTDDGGTERTCNAEQLEPFRETNQLLGGKRLFHDIISYHIWVELDNETGYTVPMVAEAQFGAEDISGSPQSDEEP